MTPFLSFVMPFYRNPGMLAHQYAAWAAYPADLKAQIEIVLVDDASPQPAVDVPRPDGLPPLRIFRLLPTPQDTTPPWRQHAARNRGAYEAIGDWLLLTDMDHVVPAESLSALLTRLRTADRLAVHTFHRVDAPKLTPTLNDRGERKPHVNTFAVTKEKYWKVGGYDEDCVGYGTDSYFRRRLYEEQPATFLADVPIVRYPREVIADASTKSDTPMDPRAFRNLGRRSAETKRRIQDKVLKRQPIRVLTYAWEAVL